MNDQYMTDGRVKFGRYLTENFLSFFKKGFMAEEAMKQRPRSKHELKFLSRLIVMKDVYRAHYVAQSILSWIFAKTQPCSTFDPNLEVRLGDLCLAPMSSSLMPFTSQAVTSPKMKA